MNLILYRRVEELLYNLYPRLIRFPKAEKHCLCKSIKDTLYGILKCIALGNYVKSKRRTYLQEADGYLKVLKVLIKLSHRQKYLSNGLFRNYDLELTEISKMLSGYIRSVNT